MSEAGRGRSILFRCDGNPECGLGHLSRCIALAEALEEMGCRLRFVGQFARSGEAMLAAAGYEPIPLEGVTGDTADRSATLAAAEDGVVIDSYGIGSDYVAEAESVAPVLLIDDFALLPRYPSSMVLNFTVGAGSLSYPAHQAVTLFGPAFFLARRPLRSARREIRKGSGKVSKVLVAMGGYDRFDLTERLPEVLHRAGADLEVRVVVSGGNARRQAIENVLEPDAIVSGATDLAEPLAWADFCVCGGGLIKYEAAYLGVPAAVFSQTPEQAAETRQFEERGLAFDLGLAQEFEAVRAVRALMELLDAPDALRSMSGRGREVFPVDPTAAAAAAFMDVLKRRSKCR